MTASSTVSATCWSHQTLNGQWEWRRGGLDVVELLWVTKVLTVSSHHYTSVLVMSYASNDELHKCWWQFTQVLNELHKCLWWITQALMMSYTSTDNKLHKYWQSVTQVLNYTSTDDEIHKHWWWITQVLMTWYTSADDELHKYWWWVTRCWWWVRQVLMMSYTSTDDGLGKCQ